MSGSSDRIGKGDGQSVRPESNYSGTDPEALEALMSTEKYPVKITGAGKGGVVFDCSFIPANDLIIGDCMYEGNILAKWEAPSDKVAILLPLQGYAEYDYKRESIVSKPGQGTILEGARTVEAHLLDRRRHLGLFMDRNKLTSQLTGMLGRTISGNIDIHPHLDLTAGPGLMLIQLVQNLRDGLRDNGIMRKSPLALSSYCDAAAYLLLENCPHRYLDEFTRQVPAPAPWHVKRAMDFMQEHIAEPLSLNEIAIAVNISVRTLQKGFRQFRNTSPMTYLHEIRMVAAHENLRDPDVGLTVREVALKWGFAHMGRFASEYRKRFGRLPSQTAKQNDSSRHDENRPNT